MAEIYTSSDDASRGLMTPDASEHINSVLADLGLTGTSPATASADAPPATPDAAPTNDEPVSAYAMGADEADTATAILAGSEPSATPAPTSQDATDSTAPHFPASRDSFGGADTLVGGLGMDTLWGSDASDPLLADGNGAAGRSADASGGDTVRAPGGHDTIYGGNATIYASGHSAESHTARPVDGTTIDGSASAQTLDGGSYDRLATILGGAGDDTIRVHDTSQDPAFAPTDTQTGSYTPYASAYEMPDGGTASYDRTAMTIEDDGSDHFAVLGSGSGHDTLDAGMGGESYWFEDAIGTDTTHADTLPSGFVPFGDGYSTPFADSGGLTFEDTVLSGG